MAEGQGPQCCTKPASKTTHINNYNKTTIRALKIEGFSLAFCKTQTASIVTILKFQWLRHCTGKQILEGFCASFKTKKIIIIIIIHKRIMCRCWMYLYMKWSNCSLILQWLYVKKHFERFCGSMQVGIEPSWRWQFKYSNHWATRTSAETGCFQTGFFSLKTCPVGTSGMTMWSYSMWRTHFHNTCIMKFMFTC